MPEPLILDMHLQDILRGTKGLALANLSMLGCLLPAEGRVLLSLWPEGIRTAAGMAESGQLQGMQQACTAEILMLPAMPHAASVAAPSHCTTECHNCTQTNT